MPRRIGHNHIGSIQHITMRGNNRRTIYRDLLDRRYFLKLLRRFVAEMDIGLLHYVLMNNHYHLLVEVRETPLDRFMWSLNRTYSFYHHKRYGQTGTLYDGRYKNFLVDNHKYFTSVVNYIVQNPVKADLVQRPVEYPWGAHAAICTGIPTFIDFRRLMALFAEDEHEALSRYMECTEDLQWSADLGYATLINREVDVPRRLLDLFGDAVYSSKLAEFPSMNTEHLLELVRDKPVSGAVRTLRNTFILIAFNDGNTLSSIARFLGAGKETVRRVVSG